jgi:hypothetical protein
MKRIAVSVSIAVVVVALSACKEQRSDSPPDQTIHSNADTAIYPKATQFCDGRVYPAGSKTHITWSAYYTNDERDRVVAFYERILGQEHEKTQDDDTWRIPNEKPVRVISVETPQKNAAVPYKDCKLPEDARTVIMISDWAG